MGYNSVLLVLNDTLHEIKNDKEFGRKVNDAVLQLGRGKQVDIPSGCCANAATAISCEHADVTQVIAVGGNYASPLGMLWGSHHTPESKLNLLRNLADEFGYTLRKKPVK